MGLSYSLSRHNDIYTDIFDRVRAIVTLTWLCIVTLSSLEMQLEMDMVICGRERVVRVGMLSTFNRYYHFFSNNTLRQKRLLFNEWM